jgi:hypothetical protein
MLIAFNENSVAGGGKINPDYLKKLKPKRGIKTTFQVKQGKAGRAKNGSISSLKICKDPGRFVSFGDYNLKIYRILS